MDEATSHSLKGLGRSWTPHVEPSEGLPSGMVRWADTTSTTTLAQPKLKTGWGVLPPLSGHKDSVGSALHLSYGQAGPTDALASWGFVQSDQGSS